MPREQKRDKANVKMPERVDRDALSPQEVADLAGFHPRTILREIERGRLRAFEPVKGHYRILVADYESWVRSSPVRPRERPARDGVERRPRRVVSGRGNIHELRAIG